MRDATLLEWVSDGIVAGYHGSTNPLPFEGCGDPFCQEARLRRDELIQALEVARLAEEVVAFGRPDLVPQAFLDLEDAVERLEALRAVR